MRISILPNRPTSRRLDVSHSASLRPAAGAFTPSSAQAEIVSPWLYLAGLCVTLSGLYAVNYGVDDQNFALMTYGLAILGYIISYCLRVYGVSPQALQVPMVVCLGLLFFAGLSSEQGLGVFAPAGIIEDRAKSLQLIFVYMAIIHSFMLSNDAAVLFACVPCMTMLALVSTTSADSQIQNAFLVFIGAATFLMVHENYLRTRSATLLGRSPAGERRLFGGQIQLAAFCVIGALVLANAVAVPIRAVGQTLFIPSAMSALNNANKNSNSNSQTHSNVVVSERNSIDLAGGQGSESDVPLLRVKSDRGLYWLGTTFDYYTGHSFESHTGDSQRLDGVSESGPGGGQEYTGFFNSDTRGFGTEYRRFDVPKSPYELLPADMKGGQDCKQTVTILGGTITQLYGASEMRQVDAPQQELQYSAAGGLTASARLPFRSNYVVTSHVPDDDPDHLRKASSSLREIPPAIADMYLQLHPDSAPENLRLRSLARELTRGLKNNYDKADAIKQYIAQHCQYNLQAPAAPRDKDIVEYFLFESHQGYCDKFAASMVMLCRYAGIPARLASGFLTGDIDKDQTYIVREKHKHLWAEVFFPHTGWVAFDATDGAEDISNHTAQAKTKTAGFLGWLLSTGWTPRLIGTTILFLLAYLLKTELWDRFRPRRVRAGRADARPQTNIEVVAAYTAACQRLARRGLARSAAMTPDEYRLWIEQRASGALPGLQAPLDQLTALHAQFRYGAATATEEDVAAARAAAAAISAALAHAKRRAVLAEPAHATA